jgi:hypothetical protein
LLFQSKIIGKSYQTQGYDHEKHVILPWGRVGNYLILTKADRVLKIYREEDGMI